MDTTDLIFKNGWSILYVIEEATLETIAVKITGSTYTLQKFNTLVRRILEIPSNVATKMPSCNK